MNSILNPANAGFFVRCDFYEYHITCLIEMNFDKWSLGSAVLSIEEASKVENLISFFLLLNRDRVIFMKQVILGVQPLCIRNPTGSHWR